MKDDITSIGREVVIYAFCTSLRSQGLDLFDIYSALILQSGAIPKDNFATVSEIQEYLHNNLIYRAKVNIPALQAFIARAEKKGYVTRLSGPPVSYKLTPSAIEHINMINDVIAAKEMGIKRLCENASTFCRNKDYAISKERVRNVLISFIRKNINGLSQLVHTNNHRFIDNILDSSPVQEKLLLEYVNFVKDKGDPDFLTFKEMLYGSILSVVFGAESSDISIIENKHISPCLIYLDTNFSFSVFDMHPDEESKSARQLFGMLQKNNFDIRVIDVTIDEIRRVISGYLPYYSYREEMRLKGTTSEDYPFLGTSLGLYRHLYEAHHYTPQMALEFAKNVKENFQKYKMQIDIISPKVKDEYLKLGEVNDSLIRQRKPRQSPKSRGHDIIAIEYIKSKRHQKAWKIEEAGAFFLTSDKILSELNYTEMGHKNDNSLCEVIHDRFLAGILWLKDPSLDFPLETLMAANSRELHINKYVWEEFCHIIASLLDKGMITEDDLINLFLNNYYLEDFLSKVKEEKISEKINEKMMIELVGKVDNIRNKENQIREEKVKELRKEIDQLKMQSELYQKELDEDKIMYVALLSDNQHGCVVRASRDLARITVRYIFIISILIILSASIVSYLALNGRIVVYVLLALALILITNIFLKVGNSWPWYVIKLRIIEKAESKYHAMLDTNKSNDDISSPCPPRSQQ